MSEFSFKQVYGPEINEHLDDISRIRITVFREWPYLYEGSPEYEADYLSVYVKHPRALCILCYHGQSLVGVSTLMPLAGEHYDLQKPVADYGFDVSRLFYYSESCMLPEFRGRGIYREFFRRREEHVRSYKGDYDRVCFCSVVRPENHPFKPVNHNPLDDVWRRYGFEKVSGLQMSFLWTDVGNREETRKALDVWMKEL